MIAPVDFTLPEGVPDALLSAPWVRTLAVDPVGMVLTFTRQEGEFRSFVIVAGRGFIWGVQYVHGVHPAARTETARSLAEAVERASDQLETASIMARMRFN